MIQITKVDCHGSHQDEVCPHCGSEYYDIVAEYSEDRSFTRECECSECKGSFKLDYLLILQ